MDPDAGRDFLRQHHRAVLITIRSNGRPQASPVVAGLDDGGRAVVSTRETAMKTAHVRARPWAALCAMHDEFFGGWVQVEGAADVLPLPAAMAGLVALYRQVAGEHEDWEDFRSAMQRERRVLLRVSLDRVGPDRSG